MPDKSITSRDQQQAIGHAANQVAARHAFEDYRERKSFQTKRRQDADLRLFSEFLKSVGISAPDMHKTPESWAFVTWGLVRSFVGWQLKKGYAVGSINVRLSTIKVYAGLALQTMAITPEQHALIQTVKSYSYGEGINLDEGRDITRIGKKKAEPTLIGYNMAQHLKHHHPNHAQGRRDRLLMNLLLEHGMRIGEVHILKVGWFNFENDTVRFWRPKVKLWSTHRFTDDSRAALLLYLNKGDMPTNPDAPLLRASERDKSLSFEGVTSNRLSDRVREIGFMNHIENLSPHDCRHYWATRAAMVCKDPFQLQEAGGWSSLAMPRRYIRMAEIANEGMNNL